MRVSYQWLREYVDVDISPRELAERLTLAGLAVDAVDEPGAGIEKVVTGRILKIEKHPNADKLVVCTVDVGQGEPLQIVTGATNVRAGHVVPVALEGAKLAGGLQIKRSKLRGVESRGMLCSGQELGMETKLLTPEMAHGVLILPENVAVGVDAREVLGLNDAVLELDLTPNRGDALSMVGVAREVAALLNKELKMPNPQPAESEEKIDRQVRVDIQAPDLCRRYVARLIKGIKIGPSPMWLQNRLRAAGVRPINNVVDVTNYVMLELGQPLHAFDYDKINNGHIIVRRAAEGEKTVSLDGVERTLSADMLVIADAAGPVAVAGVMGGQDSEVTEATVNVLIESAYFHPTCVRRTSKGLGLRSESSLRFEKGVDINGCLKAAERAVELIRQLAGGTVVAGVVDNFPRPVTEKTVSLRPWRVNRVLGVDIPRQDIVDIMQRLQFRVQEQGDDLLVTVPTCRPDITGEWDLVEEVARIYGFDRIPETLPFGASTQGRRTPEQQLLWEIRDVMTACGFYETVTYSFVHPRIFDLMNLPADSPFRNAVRLQNPLSEEQSVMRTVLVPSLLEVLQRNLHRQVQYGALFEIARVFYPVEGQALPEEVPVLAAVAVGQRPRTWNQPALPMDFFFMKGVAEQLLASLGFTETVFARHQDPSFHPGRCARIEINGQLLGVVGELHPDVIENYELSQRAVALKLDLRQLILVKRPIKQYRGLPKFPLVERDLAVLVKQEVLAAELLSVIKKAGGNLLKHADIFDVYQGSQVPEGYKSVAISMVFQAPDRTLTDEEINDKMQRITNSLTAQTGAVLRQ
ncbi:phenylalanine--tRNA ligase subunit beta [Desulforamulus hydrothermalis]|uniref:Phenylalanine--tRNA ligase beta subunit n=1 Tax=Desulforamulus hydrothermalis Lam5 = DSM 18033 TaxID=1121428 RepID=K8E709_9FIRM|nr:phenylalanine--tRNA ligase subunit beta [Desulforamulus hydrothermalis]CCO07263.1 Phenylalanine--tRNA ligase beta subunit [Desulforamulus hydrothermalis Lam5 = DSM 18033]SHG92620.1 phenylalanyl-tRNA synthetase beta subunit [Desulforamulus hydrothermalis Lam5 = DSM 18033]